MTTHVTVRVAVSHRRPRRRAARHGEVVFWLLVGWWLVPTWLITKWTMLGVVWLAMCGYALARGGACPPPTLITRMLRASWP